MIRIIRIISIAVLLQVSFLQPFAQTTPPTAEEILRAIDDNLTSESRIVSAHMVVKGRRSTRTVSSKSWIEGRDRAFTEYLSPAREKGTKMLKTDDRLWTYTPGTDRVIQISGHMLRQRVMGSDLSYEDMMEDQKLIDVYEAEVTGSDSIEGRDCWVLHLTAKEEGLAYNSRKMWVDKERNLPLREERFARSGKLIKSTRITEVMRVDERWYPKVIIFKDELNKNGKGTEYILDEIEFDAKIPALMFSKASLRK